MDEALPKNSPSPELARRGLTVSRPRQEPLLLSPVFVLVLWVFCLAVGAVGFVIPYSQPEVHSVRDPVVEVRRLEVELTDGGAPSVESTFIDSAVPRPPEALKLPAVPQLGALIALAAPSTPDLANVAALPSVVFPRPVDSPAGTGPNDQALRNPRPSASQSPMRQPLTFGEGDGKQPSPDYPRQALREGHEGTVVVRLTVAPDGHVVAANAHVPSPWPLLDEAALQAVLRKWRFSAGETRLFEVPIRFKIRQ